MFASQAGRTCLPAGLSDSEHTRAYSSVRLEHLPFKQGVLGSNPSGPTQAQLFCKFSAFLHRLVAEITKSQGDCAVPLASLAESRRSAHSATVLILSYICFELWGYCITPTKGDKMRA